MLNILKILNKYLFILTAIVVGILGVSFVDSNGDDVNSSVESSVKSTDTEKIHRSPFSVPDGIRTKRETFKKGEVAESVIGIFRSGTNVRAVINGKWTAEGDKIGDEKVLEIRRDAVVMVGKEGDKRELLLPWTETDLKVIKKVKPPKTKEEK